MGWVKAASPSRLYDIKTSVRSGGEVHISSVPTGKYFNVDCLLENSDDIMALLLTVHNMRVNTLTINYLPYARQDRQFGAEPFSLQVVAQLINNIEANRVVLLNPHSDVAPALINNCEVITMVEKLFEANYNHSWPLDILSESTLVLAPDQGAYKKLQHLSNQINVGFAVKYRDKEGQPRIEDIYGVNFHEHKNILLVDDICDGGRTFIELAQHLEERRPVMNKDTKFHLFTTYGIYSNGLDDLLAYYENIYYNVAVNNKHTHKRLIQI